MASEAYLPAKPDKRANEAGLHWEEGDFAARYPALYSLLAIARAGGAPREGATITVFCEGGSLKACINDRATDQSLFLTVDEPELLWDTLDSYIKAHPGAWRERVEPKNRRR